MPYRKRKLDADQTSPPLDPLRGGRPMSRARASSIHATGDRVLHHGRRILAQGGLHGAAVWRISNDEPGSGGGVQLYPAATDEQIVMHVPPTRLTPGHFVRFHVIANPSGATEKLVGGAVYAASGASGKARVFAVYTNSGGSVHVQTELTIPASTEEWFAQPSADGGAWTQLYRRRSPLLLPADLASIANLADWTGEDVTVELFVIFIGSPRVIDVVAFEEPLALGVDLAAGDWIAPMHSGPGGVNLGQLPGTVPVTKRSASDPGAGAEIVCDSAARVIQEIGPVLVAQSVWSESDQGFEPAAREQSTTSLAWVELWSGSTTDYLATQPGWSASSGANARRVQESETSVVMRDADNVAPVRCWIYARTNDPAGTADVRFETARYSIAELQVSGDTWAWYSVTGTLRCGLGAQNPVALAVRGKSNFIGVGLEWRYLFVAFDPL